MIKYSRKIKCSAQRDIGHRALKARFGQIVDMTREAIPQPEGPARALAAEDPGAASLAHYIARSSCHPVFDQTEVTYFSLGEEKLRIPMPSILPLRISATSFFFRPERTRKRERTNMSIPFSRLRNYPSCF